MTENLNLLYRSQAFGVYASGSIPSARIETWKLRLQAYQYRVKYKPGKANMSDCLSRLIPERNKGLESTDVTLTL